MQINNQDIVLKDTLNGRAGFERKYKIPAKKVVLGFMNALGISEIPKPEVQTEKAMEEYEAKVLEHLRNTMDYDAVLKMLWMLTYHQHKGKAEFDDMEVDSADYQDVVLNIAEAVLGSFKKKTEASTTTQEASL